MHKNCIKYHCSTHASYKEIQKTQQQKAETLNLWPKVQENIRRKELGREYFLVRMQREKERENNILGELQLVLIYLKLEGSRKTSCLYCLLKQILRLDTRGTLRSWNVPIQTQPCLLVFLPMEPTPSLFKG